MLDLSLSAAGIVRVRGRRYDDALAAMPAAMADATASALTYADAVAAEEDTEDQDDDL